MNDFETLRTPCSSHFLHFLLLPVMIFFTAMLSISPIATLYISQLILLAASCLERGQMAARVPVMGVAVIDTYDLLVLFKYMKQLLGQ